jgi:hypothetical protein
MGAVPTDTIYVVGYMKPDPRTTTPATLRSTITSPSSLVVSVHQTVLVVAVAKPEVASANVSVTSSIVPLS